VWRPFAGQLGLFFGIITAGVALALQDVVGALAGTLSVASGGIFRVGDRIELGGVRGDVIDISLLRTTLMEVGPTTDGGMEVHGRQYTGRLISISNKAIFSAPVFNYTAAFEFTWEEIVLPIPYTANWGAADAILQEEAERISASEGASAAIELMARRYPLGRADVGPRVFARATDNYLELAARFVVPVRRSRIAKDEITRRVVTRLEAAGIPIASQTVSVTVEQADRPAG
jgi:small-conductance mechanosensitive channel